jgi:hypothetical protein
LNDLDEDGLYGYEDDEDEPVQSIQKGAGVGGIHAKSQKMSEITARPTIA